MRWLAKHTKIEPVDGSVRVERRFAFFPHYIAGTMVWLETYEILQVYRIHEEKVTIDDKQITLLAGQWINLGDK